MTSHSPEAGTHTPLIPVRMLNEFVYCPRLAYMMWAQGEFAHNEFTVDGVLRHRHVDEGQRSLPESAPDDLPIKARAVSLSSDQLGLTAKMDLVEGKGNIVSPIDYKRGKRPHVAGGVHEPERVQLCAQGLLLREHGYDCDEGMIYFVASHERVPVSFDEHLISKTLEYIRDFRVTVQADSIPLPLEDSPKCPHCSLVGICLPDEVRFLAGAGCDMRPVMAHDKGGLPLYVQSPKAYVRRDSERLIIEEDNAIVAHARLAEISQVALFGNAVLTTPALHECLRREIPVTYLSYGGWFVGHTVGTGHRNVETRTHQYRASFAPQACLGLARRLVAGKITNCRTLLRRNWRETAGDRDNSGDVDRVLASLKSNMRHALCAQTLDELLGIEGAAASCYYQAFASMIKSEDPGLRFDFTTRNRRPPHDPVNAMLSFAYAMLVREWTVTLSAVGLDPYRGFYHQPRFGRPALSLDMMEPFRPLVADSVVITVMNNGEVQPDDFIHAAGSCSLTPSSRKAFIAAFERRMGHEVIHPIFGYTISYRRLFEVQARLLIRHLAGEIPTYPVFMTR